MKRTALFLTIIMIVLLLLSCGKQKEIEYPSTELTGSIVTEETKKIVPTALTEEEKNAPRNDSYWIEDVLYKIDFDGDYDSTVGRQVGIYYVEKYDGKELVWRCALMQNTAEGECILWNYSIGVVSDGVIVCGNADDNLNRKQQASFYVAKVSAQGTLLWTDELDANYHNAGFSTLGIGIAENQDRTYTIFFCANKEDGTDQFCMVKYDQNGNVLEYAVIDNKHYYSIEQVLLYDDGYMMQLAGGIAFIDKNYSITRVNLLGNGWGAHCFLEDIAVIDGEIYLSVGIFNSDRNSLNALYEYDSDTDKILCKGDLTATIVKASVGKLLRYNPLEHNFKELYSVDGALGGKICVAENGEFHWYVQSIVSTYHSPYTSSFTYGGTCYVYRYTLDQNCKVTAEFKTGFLTSIRFL